MTTWFISDLHLEPARPASVLLLFEFLEHIRGKADALYILGDFFEYWIGDDVLDTPAGQPVLTITAALQLLVESGVPVYFIHGNRDFLLGEDFAQRSGCQLLPEQQLIDLYGTPTLIMHGDTLCTDDVDYQQARKLFRDSRWQAEVMRLSIPERLQRAQAMRLQSQESTQGKLEQILDVNPQTVRAVMQDYGVQRLIHGHTHRPATHDFLLNDKPAQRIVLGDWYRQGSFLRVDTAQRMQLGSDFR